MPCMCGDSECASCGSAQGTRDESPDEAVYPASLILACADALQVTKRDAPLIVAVCGSRSLARGQGDEANARRAAARTAVWDALDRTRQELGGRLAAHAIKAVVHGGAAGPDSWAGLWARQHLVPEVVVPYMNRLNAQGGHARNGVIVDLCDKLIAVWDGKSGGTAGTIELARAAGKVVEVVEVKL